MKGNRRLIAIDDKQELPFFIKRLPTITVESIKKGLKARGINFENHIRSITKEIIAGDNYANSSYIAFFIDDDVYDNYEDPKVGRIAQAIVEMLREACPNDNCVLVDVTW